MTDVDEGQLAGVSAPATGGFNEQELYRAVLDSLPDVTVYVFGPDLRYTLVAGGAFSKTGWTREQLEGHRPSELVGDAGHEIEALMRAALQGEIRRRESPGLRRDDIIWDNTVAPLYDAEGSVIGGIVVSRDVGAIRLAEAQQRSMEEVATAAGRLAEFERRQRERLEFMAEINGVLADCENRRDIMRAVTRSAVPRLGDWCTIYVLLDPHRPAPAIELAHLDPEMEAYARDLQDRFPYDPDATRGVAAVIRTGRPTLFEDVSEELMDEAQVSEETREVVRRLGLRSVVIVPLVKKHQVIGALEFFATGDRRYGPDDLTLAEAVAGRVASALDNRRLADQQREIARTLQDSLLPDHLPAVPRVDLAVRYWAAGEGTEVGGDFYDVFPVDEGAHALVIGDVCGNGATSAAVTALARHTIRAGAWRGDDPAAVISNLNTAMVRTRPGTFCTVAYAALRPDGEGVRAALAVGGHPLPLVVSADGSVGHVGRTGRLLGVFESTEHPVTEVSLQPGDTLVLYTDGAYDLPPPYGLTTEELAELVAEGVRGAPDAETAAERVSASLAAHRPFVERGDDVALVVARIVPGTES